MISVLNLTKKFDNFTAVDNLSLNVKSGEVLGFLGPNGAGKSTTMKMITGFMKPTNGEIKVKGMDVETNQIECKKLIGYLPEGAPLYGDMTPLNMLKFVAYIRGMSSQEFKKALDTSKKVFLSDKNSFVYPWILYASFETDLWGLT